MFCLICLHSKSVWNNWNEAEQPGPAGTHGPNVPQRYFSNSRLDIQGVRRKHQSQIGQGQFATDTFNASLEIRCTFMDQLFVWR